MIFLRENKKHHAVYLDIRKYKKYIMPGILLAAMFFAGEGFGLMADNVVKTGVILNETADWGLGFGQPGTQPVGNAGVDEMKEYNAYYMGSADMRTAIRRRYLIRLRNIMYPLLFLS